ncbi:MAG: hypothetical protein HY512_02505 [Candidatus Aenigmarchaeota archaeon]|nr:hypothetical protein [Candidatus Aenigmarchaeota archaeon]
MTQATELIEMRRDIVTSSHPCLGVAYRSPAYSFRYSSTLVCGQINYYALKEQIPKGRRISTAAEELAIQLGLERVGQDPRKAQVFSDLFADHIYSAWQWTETGLKVPKGWEGGRYQTDSKGNKQFPRIILIGDQEVGEALVPEGNGRAVVVEWNEVFGIPSITSDSENSMIMRNHTTHFDFNPTPNIDERTGRPADIAVTRRSYCHGDEQDVCLSVDADIGRSDSRSGDSFRLVQGPIPEIERLVA